MNIRNKLLISILISIIFFDLSIYTLYFLISLNYIKKEGELKVSRFSVFNEKVELIVINKSNINNKVEFTSNNEINFNGIMYEVSRIDKDESNIYIYCIKDEEETNLINSYKKLISNTNNNTKSKNTQNIMCFYFLGLLNNLINIPKNNNFLILSLFTKENIIHNFIPPLSPPPKIFITLKNI